MERTNVNVAGYHCINVILICGWSVGIIPLLPSGYRQLCSLCAGWLAARLQWRRCYTATTATPAFDCHRSMQVSKSSSPFLPLPIFPISIARCIITNNIHRDVNQPVNCCHATSIPRYRLDQRFSEWKPLPHMGSWRLLVASPIIRMLNWLQFRKAALN